jgi:hypothetical protein
MLMERWRDEETRSRFENGQGGEAGIADLQYDLSIGGDAVGQAGGVDMRKCRQGSEPSGLGLCKLPDTLIRNPSVEHCHTTMFIHEAFSRFALVRALIKRKPSVGTAVPDAISDGVCRQDWQIIAPPSILGETEELGKGL